MWPKNHKADVGLFLQTCSALGKVLACKPRVNHMLNAECGPNNTKQTFGPLWLKGNNQAIWQTGAYCLGTIIPCCVWAECGMYRMWAKCGLKQFCYVILRKFLNTIYEVKSLF